MEVLNKLLTLIPVTGRVDVRCHFGPPWRIEQAAANQWEVPYHVLLSGEAVVENDEGRALRMGPGDIVLFPAREGHRLHDGSGKRARRIHERQADGLTLADNDAKVHDAELLCGRFLLPVVPQRLLLDHLPGMLLVRGMQRDADGTPAAPASFAGTRLARLIELMREEAREQPPGSEAVINQLSGALFAMTLRFASESPEPPRGLLALAQQPRLQPALAAMFDEPGHDWTLPVLAARCNMSRATFVRHFDEAFGRSPSELLTEIRMTLAGRKLAQTPTSVAAIGESVGYRSDAAFQRVFKRTVGMTPAQWRARARSTART
ncbi:AraC family transcriptional regulator [Trinickia caryophylli]|nr:AraC family transcriptional regulator [Trinickia caryophylli]TRX15472.1 AraC family transcriptional regulator [Trinickia caryophylli]